MNRPPTVFKDTQYFDWDSEPSLERSSTFFYPEELSTSLELAHQRRRRANRGSTLAVLAGCAAVLGAGVFLMVFLAPLLQRLF